MGTTTRLTVYNDALILLGERSLASLTENREPRRLLDQVWNNDGVDACLEEGQWHFATRGVRLDYDPAASTEFGYQYVFNKPSDWIRTEAVCTDEWFNVPLTRYGDESGYWYSDEQILYIKYVSNDAFYGNNLAIWPRSFSEFVSAHFAWKIAFKLGGESLMKEMISVRDEMLRRAKNKAAADESTKFPARGSWVNARQRYGGPTDGGNRGGSLIG